jgi:hypothetical protein
VDDGAKESTTAPAFVRLVYNAVVDDDTVCDDDIPGDVTLDGERALIRPVALVPLAGLLRVIEAGPGVVMVPAPPIAPAGRFVPVKGPAVMLELLAEKGVPCGVQKAQLRDWRNVNTFDSISARR